MVQERLIVLPDVNLGTTQPFELSGTETCTVTVVVALVMVDGLQVIVAPLIIFAVSTLWAAAVALAAVAPGTMARRQPW